MSKEMQWTLGLIAITIGLMRSTMLVGDVRPALAMGLSGQGGSSSLADWQGVIDQSAELKREVAIALPRLHRSSEEVICSGVRLGHNLDPLAGYRVTPVDCWFDGWVLHLEADNFARREDGTTVPLERLLDRSERERSQFTGVSFKLKAWRWYPASRDD